MISRIDHIAIAVSDYPKALEFFQNIFGAVPGASLRDDHLQFYWQILSVGDLSRLELLTPTGPDSFLKRFLSEKEGGVHHITLETPDIHAAKARLDELGIPCFGFGDSDPDWKELFIHPKHAFGVLIQIAEFRPDNFLADEVRLKDDAPWQLEKTTDGARLILRHPGGGTVAKDLSREEMARLAADLNTVLAEHR